MKAVVQLFDFRQQVNYRTEILSGLTVALALVPEAVAFSIIAGLSPLIGLYAAFVMGLVTALFGGRPGMISGATGAVAVVIVSLVKSHGQEYIFATVILAGIIQMLAGVMKLGKFIRLVPQSVMYGFVNGLAIIIFMAQLVQFQYTDTAGVQHWLQGASLWTMLGLLLITMVIIWGLPRLTKAFPASLAAILVVSAIVIGVRYPRRQWGTLPLSRADFRPFTSLLFHTTWKA
jgi:SulP family sulfate permease